MRGGRLGEDCADFLVFALIQDLYFKRGCNDCKIAEKNECYGCHFVAWKEFWEDTGYKTMDIIYIATEHGSLIKTSSDFEELKDANGTWKKSNFATYKINREFFNGNGRLARRP